MVKHHNTTPKMMTAEFHPKTSSKIEAGIWGCAARMPGRADGVRLGSQDGSSVGETYLPNSIRHDYTSYRESCGELPKANYRRLVMQASGNEDDDCLGTTVF